ncbi:MAG: glycoside hydrolase family 76 protein, partial [Nitrospirales bacterium]
LHGCLDDYTFLGAALLDAYEATANPTYLDRASEVTELVLDRFWDEEAGGFFMTGRDHEPLLQRMKPGTDSAIPSGNSVAVMNLLRLFAYLGEQRYLDRAEQTLRVFRTVMGQNAYGSAGLLCALDFYLAKPKEIVLVGSRTDPRLQDLLRRLHGRYVPNKTLVVVVPEAGNRVRVPEGARGKGMIDGRPTAYVCHDFTCSQPVTEWSALQGLL